MIEKYYKDTNTNCYVHSGTLCGGANNAGTGRMETNPGVYNMSTGEALTDSSANKSSCMKNGQYQARVICTKLIYAYEDRDGNEGPCMYNH